jgi:hypothetical protein
VNDSLPNYLQTAGNGQMAQCWFKEPHYLSSTTDTGLATAVDEEGGYQFEFQNAAENNSAALAYANAANHKWFICEVVDDYSIVVMRKATGAIANADPTVDIGIVTANTRTNLGWLNYYASDKDFYIGCNFESHGEHSKMISGLDLTNSVPLHLNLNLSHPPGATPAVLAPAAPIGHQMSVFVHHDSLLRIEPTGEVTTASH